MSSVHVCTQDGAEIWEWDTDIRGIHGPEYLEGRAMKGDYGFLSPINQVMVSCLLKVFEDASEHCVVGRSRLGGDFNNSVKAYPLSRRHITSANMSSPIPIRYVKPLDFSIDLS
jgi:hypothetical protein